MPLITSENAPVFETPGATFVGLAAPSRGSLDTSAWRVTLAPHSPGLPHRVTREEIFVALSGRAMVQMFGIRTEFAEGSALVVPALEPFSIANESDEPFEAIAILPVGGAAIVGDGPAFIPPWAS
ncbi:MAG: cupin domain-containing protein [Vicinamibacteria bacterium]